MFQKEKGMKKDLKNLQKRPLKFKERCKKQIN